MTQNLVPPLLGTLSGPRDPLVEGLVQRPGRKGDNKTPFLTGMHPPSRVDVSGRNKQRYPKLMTPRAFMYRLKGNVSSDRGEGRLLRS